MSLTNWMLPLHPAADNSPPMTAASQPEATDSTPLPEVASADALRSLGRAVISTEAAAVSALADRIDDCFVEACRLFLGCRGRIVVSGMGKSGHIASKIAATLASTGTPAFFVHPGEAGHGDLGMVCADDVFVAISYSGNSDELLTLLPVIKRLGVPLVVLCGKADSALARAADVWINIAVAREACPMGLAPTASTTATLAMGDALAVALLSARGFSENDFARSHPLGSLGRRLLLQVDDVMVSGDEVPRCSPNYPLPEALLEISAKGLGMVVVCDAEQRLLGVFTDGDLRRTIDQGIDFRDIRICDVMTDGAQSTTTGTLAANVVQQMQHYRISSLPVLDSQQRVCGAVTMHQLLAAGLG